MASDSGPNARQLRAIGHKLKPVLSIAHKGLSDGVLLELDRALTDHELIKVKIPCKAKGSQHELFEAICKKSSAKIVQRIGNVLLLIRRSENPNPKLSNLIRKF